MSALDKMMNKTLSSMFGGMDLSQLQNKAEQFFTKFLELQTELDKQKGISFKQSEKIHLLEMRLANLEVKYGEGVTMLEHGAIEYTPAHVVTEQLDLSA